MSLFVNHVFYGVWWLRTSTLQCNFEHRCSKSGCFTVVASDLFTTLWGIIFEIFILPFVFEGHFSFYKFLFSRGVPRNWGEPHTHERVLCHMEVRTLYARPIFREKSTKMAPECQDALKYRAWQHHQAFWNSPNNPPDLSWNGVGPGSSDPPFHTCWRMRRVKQIHENTIIETS